MKSGESFSINLKSIFDPIIIKIIMRKIKIENRTLDKIFKILSIECLTTLLTHLTLPLTSQFTKTIKIVSLGYIPDLISTLGKLTNSKKGSIKYKIEKIIKTITSKEDKTLVRQIFAYRVTYGNQVALILGFVSKDEQIAWIIGDPLLILNFIIEELPLTDQDFFPFIDCPHVLWKMLKESEQLIKKYKNYYYYYGKIKGYHKGKK